MLSTRFLYSYTIMFLIAFVRNIDHQYYRNIAWLGNRVRGAGTASALVTLCYSDAIVIEAPDWTGCLVRRLKADLVQSGQPPRRVERADLALA
jgi:hypothetical protein